MTFRFLTEEYLTLLIAYAKSGYRTYSGVFGSLTIFNLDTTRFPVLTLRRGISAEGFRTACLYQVDGLSQGVGEMCTYRFNCIYTHSPFKACLLIAFLPQDEACASSL